MNAIFLPSGDQAGSSSWPPLLRRVRAVPSARTVYSSQFIAVTCLVKTILLPSGDQLGSSFAAPPPTTSRMSEPSVAIVSIRPPSPTNAIRPPVGAQLGLKPRPMTRPAGLRPVDRTVTTRMVVPHVSQSSVPKTTWFPSGDHDGA